MSVEYTRINRSFAFWNYHSFVCDSGTWFKPSSTEKTISYAFTAVSFIPMKKLLLKYSLFDWNLKCLGYDLITSMLLKHSKLYWDNSIIPSPILPPTKMEGLFTKWKESKQTKFSSVCGTVVNKIIFSLLEDSSQVGVQNSRVFLRHYTDKKKTSQFNSITYAPLI